ncbi:putative Protein phosphatase 2C [Blattamonas nauphoetae]|uniref:PPM-type phosphatase domain-containing protein n=1 Tax=Blattamonas nauphoetae TaxID=2049346 RepID=A0ABQ9Y0U7_9EUKA|nr:putative Protein phosphatase 2C [Blattamonas nauphoetae]
MSRTSHVLSDYGFAEDANPSFRSDMEDGHTHVDPCGPTQNMAFLGIYDGHGGRDTVTYIQRHLHERFLFILQRDTWRSAAQAGVEAFRVTDSETASKNCLYDGCTAIVVIVEKKQTETGLIYHITSLNCGDARAVLVRNGVGRRISCDHKPGLPSESDRIRSAGGFVAGGRVNGLLSVSRSFGDHAMKKLIICDPFVSETTIDPSAPPPAPSSPLPQVKTQPKQASFAGGLRGTPKGGRKIQAGKKPSEDETNEMEMAPQTPLSPKGSGSGGPQVSETVVSQSMGDVFVILACDGVWDVIGDDEAAEIIKPYGDNCRKAADVLVKAALEKGTMDNVSVIVARL